MIYRISIANETNIVWWIDLNCLRALLERLEIHSVQWSYWVGEISYFISVHIYISFDIVVAEIVRILLVLVCERLV